MHADIAVTLGWQRALRDAGLECETTSAATTAALEGAVEGGCDVVFVHATGALDAHRVVERSRGRTEAAALVVDARGADLRGLDALDDDPTVEVWRHDDVADLRRVFARALAHARTRNELRRARSEIDGYRRFFVEGPVIVFRWTACEGWPVEAVSPNVRAVFGVSAEDLQSGRVAYASVVHPDDIARVAAEVDAYSAAGAAGFDQEYRIVQPDGDVRWLFDHTVITRDASGAITHYEGYVLDQTAYKVAQLQHEEMQRALLHAQKLESLGVMAGGIAHDFNNLLTSIMGNAGLALGLLDDAAGARVPLQKLLSATERAAALTRQMLAYAGRCSFDRRRIDVSEHAREVVALLAAMLPKKVSIELDLAAGLPAVDADPAQLQQVLMNLALNAAEACDDACGNVRIVTRRVAGTQGPARNSNSPEPVPSAWVVIEVRDDGAGIDAATQRRIFDPFFTTKTHGRGLGLSAVLGIVRAHGGEIEIDSAVGRGATFSVFLPASEARTVAIAAPPPVVDVRGEGLVLVVDDEPAVLAVTVRILQTHGYRVLEATDGIEALTTYCKAADSIDVLVLDRTMPRMDGLEALAALRALGHNVSVVVTSGYDEREVAACLAADGRALFLRKPYTMEALGVAVAAARGLAARSTHQVR